MDFNKVKSEMDNHEEGKARRLLNLLLVTVISLFILQVSISSALGIFVGSLKDKEINSLTGLYLIASLQSEVDKIRTHYADINTSSTRDQISTKSYNIHSLFDESYRIIDLIENGGHFTTGFTSVENVNIEVGNEDIYLAEEPAVFSDELNLISQTLAEIEHTIPDLNIAAGQYISAMDTPESLMEVSFKYHELFFPLTSRFMKIETQIVIIHHDLCTRNREIKALTAKIEPPFYVLLIFIVVGFTLLIIVRGSGILKEVNKIHDENMRSKNEFKTIIETAPIGIGYVKDRILGFTNKAFQEMTGYSRDSITGKSARLLYETNKEFERVGTDMYPRIMEKGWDEIETSMVRKDGSKFDIHLTSGSINNKDLSEGLIFTVTDISEIKRNERKLKDISSSLETLLQEVNHRVKNNLMAITGLLIKEKNKASGLKNRVQLEFLETLIARIGSLSTVHKLLSSTKWGPLYLSELCREVINYVIDSMGTKGDISLQIDRSETKVDSTQAHHIALVINEIATNVIKHAVTDQVSPVVRIHITENYNEISMFIRDNGPGFPDDLLGGDYQNIGMGLDLIHGIIEGSLNGSITMINNKGACFNISFKKSLQKEQQL